MLGFLPTAIGALASPVLAQGADPAAFVADDAGAGASMIPPALIVVLCVVAGVGTLLLLPSPRRESPIRKIGGVLLLAAGLILVALLLRAVAGESDGGLGVYFWVFSAIAMVGAVRVVTHPKPVYSALYFVLTVMATAGLFVLMWAEFMAAALVLIYAGAILVTYVFVIMLAAEASPAGAGAAGPDSSGPATDGNGHDGRPSLAGLAEHDAASREPLVASAVGFALLGVLLLVIFDRGDGLIEPVRSGIATVEVPGTNGERVPSGPTQELGDYLFRRQLVSLELAGLILTVAMVGAIIIARRRVVAHGPEPRPAGAAGETVVGPATPVDDNPHSIPVYGTDNPRQKAYPET